MENISGMVVESPTSAAANAAKSSKKKKCSILECANGAKRGGLCIAHGGGVRCSVLQCKNSAVGAGKCIAHGGGKKCKYHGCANSARSRGLCPKHGGGTRCKVEGCEKHVVANGLCVAHGGRRHCRMKDCFNNARKGGLCAVHGDGSDLDTKPMSSSPTSSLGSSKSDSSSPFHGIGGLQRHISHFSPSPTNKVAALRLELPPPPGMIHRPAPVLHLPSPLAHRSRMPGYNHSLPSVYTPMDAQRFTSQPGFYPSASVSFPSAARFSNGYHPASSSAPTSSSFLLNNITRRSPSLHSNYSQTFGNSPSLLSRLNTTSSGHISSVTSTSSVTSYSSSNIKKVNAECVVVDYQADSCPYNSSDAFPEEEDEDNSPNRNTFLARPAPLKARSSSTSGSDRSILASSDCSKGCGSSTESEGSAGRTASHAMNISALIA